MIPRLIEDLVFSSLTSFQKIILVLGARQVGKTTLTRSIGKRLETMGKKVLYLNCDLAEDLTALNTTSKAVLERLLVLSKIEVLLIDEAQMIENPGLTLKIIHDVFPRVKVLATGSSSFDLKNKLSDPLTGRYLDFTLYPLSFTEILQANDPSSNNVVLNNQANELLAQVIQYGLYPEVYMESNLGQKQILLDKIVESYLFKDILTFQRVKNSQAIKDLTKAIAYQIGSEINENELANRLKIDRKTVVNYLEILEKAYVIVSLHPYSRNPRREIGSRYKIYFVDLGIRNALIGDFNSLELRADTGALWENFLFIERMKLFANTGKSVISNFWRSYSGAEVDYIEKTPNKDTGAYEFKYSYGTLSRGASSFSGKYGLPVNMISRENYLDFIRTIS
ncbi:MAG: ATP-binding protein [Candidatus Roizmanbacteria bacterium]|nr:ATP-binding protein [Candidatus Roizmanbacteria bacterium]